MERLAPTHGVYTQSAVSCSRLIRRLESLFGVIESSNANKNAYGQAPRDLLLLASMEVESALAGVLREHGYTPGNWTTRDYVRLRDVLCLDSFEVSLHDYPNYPPFCPFAGWTPEQPTQSIAWYDAYNKVKHNREENMELATLGHALESVGAALVVFCAQFGFPRWSDWRMQMGPLRDVLRIECSSLPLESSYVPLVTEPVHGDAMTAWKHINYSI